jgi:hypothetical protein
MKGTGVLVVLLGAMLAGLAMIVGAPPYVEPAVRFILGAGLLGAMAIVLGGPIGKALGAQLRGDTTGGAGEGRILAQLDELSQDLQALRDDLGQLHERMDFAERLLTQRAQESRLGPGEPLGGGR